MKKAVEIPWNDYPTWVNYIALDGEFGWWYGYSTKPKLTESEWIGDHETLIPEKYEPKNFEGKWTESLFER